ncbi:MAG: hypothetical protein HKO59_04305 [Phycisphaerales bacterium]|nr:PQQ-dependent sugar dehydrogenase [Phycisphaerae bacterium]NNF42370.1 hypothetical protein [Phycisphaerales bacterium]NNM25199.1 hypothetical protein [Phycisphaerales bacterium]
MISPRLLLAASLATCAASAAASAQPAGFVSETIVTGLSEPVGLVFAPNGERLFVWDKIGRVFIVENGVVQPEPLLDLQEEVNTYWTRGLTGFALDPEYETNGYVYLMFTVDWEYYSTGGAPDPGQLDTNHDTFGRLVRWTSDPADDFRSVIPGSRWDMIGATHDTGFAVTFASHTQNTIVFADDGTMLLSAGDGASMLEVDTGGPRNPCCSSNTAEADGIVTGKEKIGAFRSQLVDSHGGKILRIDPVTAEGLPNNPYFDPAQPSAPRSRVWALGLRNPYSFAIRPGTGDVDPAAGVPGVLMIGDVGWDQWERLCVSAEGGENFGWPLFEGLIDAGGYPATTTANRDTPNRLYGVGGCGIDFFAFRDLIVQETLALPTWPNPCDPAQEIPADYTFMHQRAAMAWRNDRLFPTPLTLVPVFDEDGVAQSLSVTHPDSPVDGFHLKGRATVGGLFYDQDKFPAELRGSLFFADAGNPPGSTGWINRARFDDEHRLVEIASFVPGGDLNPTGLALDPDGYAIYYANHRAAGAGSIERIAVDCNDNGVGDDLDLEAGTSVDRNGNGLPDECDLPGDVNGDGSVDFVDLLTVLASWGDCPPPDACPADLDGSGDVGFTDLLIVLAGWTA